MKERRERRNYTEDFKKQVVNLYNNGKSRSEIIREYDLTPSAFNNWIKQYNTSGSFKAKDNRTEEEQELIELRKRNRQLEMEVDILKKYKHISKLNKVIVDEFIDKVYIGVYDKELKSRDIEIEWNFEF